MRGWVLLAILLLLGAMAHASTGVVESTHEFVSSLGDIAAGIADGARYVVGLFFTPSGEFDTTYASMLMHYASLRVSETVPGAAWITGQ